MRPRFFGQYLLSNRSITAAQLMAAIEYQSRNNTRLGERSIALGLATQFEVERICALQATEDLLFGEAAVRLGILTEQQVQRIVHDQGDAHVQLGEALVALGHLTPAQIEAAVARFATGEAEIEPEVVTIPDDLPLRDVAFELFHFAHKLLLRVCALPSKTERLRITDGTVALADRNAMVGVSGAFESAIWLCLPESVAFELSSRFSGENSPSGDEIDRVVCELSNLLCGNLQAVLAERGVRIDLGPPHKVDGMLTLPPGKRAALVPFVTHRGHVLVALSLPGA